MIKKLILILLLITNITFLANCQEKIFGNYQKPALLLKLEAYQKEHKNMVKALGFQISYDTILAYAPVDIIPFARTVGGGQLSFLTDFSSIKDLANAPIVYGRPEFIGSEATPISLFIMAKDLRSYLTFTASLNEEYYGSVMLYLAFLDSENEFYEEEKERITTYIKKSRKNGKRSKLLKQFGIDQMPDPIKMLEDVHTWRNKHATIMTEDGLGIVYGTSRLTQERFNGDEEDLGSIKTFLANSSLPQRLKWYRDVLYTDFYWMKAKTKRAIKPLVISSLNKDGYVREAEALESNYQLNSRFDIENND